MMSFWGGSPGMCPSSTSLFNFGVAVSDFDGGCVGAVLPGGPEESCCAIVGWLLERCNGCTVADLQELIG
jgi:hypothetical protein